MHKENQINKYKDKLSKFYQSYIWPDDPLSEEGKSYYERTKDYMELLMDNECIKRKIKSKIDIKVIDICGGSGIGGVALSEKLIEKGNNVELTVTDIRKEALDTGREWGEGILGESVKYKEVDVRFLYKFKEKFDIALIYGQSTPHFSPWDFIKVLSSINEILTEKGCLVVDESDRMKRIFIDMGYKWALMESQNEKEFIMSFHSGYDMKRGMVKRTYINLCESIKPFNMRLYMWNIAEMGALIWMFYENLDFMNLSGTRKFIIGNKKRNILNYKDLKLPSVIKE